MIRDINREFDKYLIQLDGSWRLTMRNRWFVRKIKLMQPVPYTPTINQSKIMPQVLGSTQVDQPQPLDPTPDISNQIGRQDPQSVPH